jgi:hypothetical protein
MKSQFLKTTVVATLLVLGLFVGNTWATKTPKAAVPSKPAQKEYKGTVEVTKDKAGDIKAVTLKVGALFKSTYHITLDKMGKELGTKMAGKKVIATGTVEKKAGAKWLTVTKYSAVTSKPKKETNKK